ncbi:hypothetical protein Acsp04_18210 [Actinomadura sp. NBRC 104425]|uniref:hypothetical protein n=1 Tax=Actinomadura sp. NBRC 104425 TaxID=3032204 RepID=UPI0024A5B29A|nr:hypothetical protein [Actinomadura sp. NBRC 104425]GLZ11586.1 hypothetical protein Acsp04_18210 [Actinomadura sp. NBRC 104425]
MLISGVPIGGIGGMRFLRAAARAADIATAGKGIAAGREQPGGRKVPRRAESTAQPPRRVAGGPLTRELRARHREVS